MGGLNERCPCQQHLVCDGSTDFCRIPNGDHCSRSSDCLTGSVCVNHTCHSRNGGVGDSSGKTINIKWDAGFSGLGGVSINIERGDSIVLTSTDGRNHMVAETNSNWVVLQRISGTFNNTSRLSLPALTNIQNSLFIMDTFNSNTMRLHIVVAPTQTLPGHRHHRHRHRHRNVRPGSSDNSSSTSSNTSVYSDSGSSRYSDNYHNHFKSSLRSERFKGVDTESVNSSIISDVYNDDTYGNFLIKKINEGKNR